MAFRTRWCIIFLVSVRNKQKGFLVRGKRVVCAAIGAVILAATAACSAATSSSSTSNAASASSIAATATTQSTAGLPAPPQPRNEKETQPEGAPESSDLNGTFNGVIIPPGTMQAAYCITGGLYLLTFQYPTYAPTSDFNNGTVDAQLHDCANYGLPRSP